ncbi:MAG: glycosyltransferase family 2 protein [Candidatus Cohnella colombiensis]|uniref:Glycosyltransferase family 2 protein n=1 Tax=Candidatus Cohnella colombiensis TaxID=3121368 RepID=A0AA95EWR8_9BACL|nr:MAG: glycosyltransferase family 2 protein [Cohnella sp.]
MKSRATSRKIVHRSKQRLHGSIVKMRRRARSKEVEVTSPVIRELFETGFAQGYQEGRQAGFDRYGIAFEGTSIVIPTYNQLSLLRQCIHSILWSTTVPFEIIVVDNASTDGTAAYLQSLGGQVRYRVLETNRGFAGAINVGMMMAKGRTILLLNNDTIMCENLLSNMLICLTSDDSIGMVGPITNNISGSQRISVPYHSISRMPVFARKNNNSNPARWRDTDLLIGFCLLFRRDLFEEVGYLDEGFEIGNYEDNDYCARVQALGKRLVVAEDAFIHHIGSVSIKAVGRRMVQVNEQNQRFFSHKWPNLKLWLNELKEHNQTEQGRLPHLSILYPENIVVKGLDATPYWIENGVRRPIVGEVLLPVIQVSQIDLRRWPVDEPIVVEEAIFRWHGYHHTTEWEVGIVMCTDGTMYHIEHKQLRPILGAAALQSWNLHLKPTRTISVEQANRFPHGLPIIALAVLRSRL